MTRPYSEDLRERALMMAEAGQTIRAIGAALQISPSCVSKWRKLKRDTGALKPGKIGGHKRRVLSGKWAAWLRRRVLSGRRRTLRGLAAELAARGVKTESRAIWVFLHAEGLSFKKNMRAAEQNRPDIARKRARWKALQGLIDPRRLVFIDETWIKTNMAPLRGWGLRGRRLETHVPYGHWTTLTFLAALRCDRLTAPCVLDGPINGESFLAYVEQILVPTLKRGDVVVLDNLGSHKGRAVRAAIRAVGTKIFFLPAYSPDLNPIAQVFAKLTHLVRNAEPRTIEETWRKVGDLVDIFAPHECANYLVNSGYASV